MSYPVNISATHMDVDTHCCYLNVIDRTAAHVARTVQLADDLLIDVDPEGHVLGVECLAGPVDANALLRVIRALTVP